MSEEISSRHQAAGAQQKLIEDNLKEGVGGLRDLEMILLIIKAECGIMQPVNSKLFTEITDKHAELREDLQRLSTAFMFLNNLRNTYRLTVGATDMILPKVLSNTARIMGYQNASSLYAEFKKTCNDVTRAISNILKKLKCD